MSRTQRFLAARWRGLATLCALIALFGIAAILWARIDTADQKAADLANEADLRGNAVTTLATDVRKLRTQLESEGKTPVAPDPTAAVDDLPDRAAVPVPIPGPKGDKETRATPETRETPRRRRPPARAVGPAPTEPQDATAWTAPTARTAPRARTDRTALTARTARTGAPGRLDLHRPARRHLHLRPR